MLKRIALCVVFLAATGNLSAQNTTFPTTKLKDLERNEISSGEILNKNGYTVISFWAIWCKPCIRELNAISELYDDWSDELDVEVVPISIDDARSSAKVPVFVNSRGWPFEVYIDENSDLKRALNINNIPHSIIVDKDGNVVWQHSGYLPGDEDVLFDQLLKLSE